MEVCLHHPVAVIIKLLSDLPNLISPLTVMINLCPCVCPLSSFHDKSFYIIVASSLASFYFFIFLLVVMD